MKIKLFVLLSLAAVLFSCSPATRLEKSWADPSLTAETVKSFRKVLVVAPLKDETSQRIAEDKLVALLKNVEAVQSYLYLTAADTDQNQVVEKLKNDGFDGTILIRLKDVEKETTYQPGTSYGGWYGYRYATPGYYSENTSFLVETNLYSLDQGKLLWSGTTSSLNPTKLDKTIDDIFATLRYEWQKKGLIK
ncbi:MAG: hypothetical protein IH598_00195 [Bacteroidales bacterium]|nr:hypothetical protein [Bacteroidales bacterium]